MMERRKQMIRKYKRQQQQRQRRRRHGTGTIAQIASKQWDKTKRQKEEKREA